MDEGDERIHLGQVIPDAYPRDLVLAGLGIFAFPVVLQLVPWDELDPEGLTEQADVGWAMASVLGVSRRWRRRLWPPRRCIDPP